MSKKESNKNIYIFWGLIALALIIVLLVIFLPRTNYARAYSNVYQMSQNIEKQDSHGKTMEYYAQSFVDNVNLTTAERQKAQSLLNLQQAMEASINYDLTASQFVENKNNINGYIKTQSSNLATAQNSINNLLEYCQNNCYQFFDGSSINQQYIKEVFNQAYMVKYKEVIQQLADFYITTATMLTNNATIGIEITQTNLASNQALMEQIKTQAYAETINSDSCRICYDTAINNLYKNFN